MSPNGFHRTSAPFFWGALLFCLLGTSHLIAQTQSSSQNSTQSSNPWQQLKALSDDLPARITIYNEALQQQIAALQQQNDSLQASNQQLTQQLADLQGSLSQSQQRVTTLSNELSSLNDSLTASTKSIKEAQAQADRDSLTIKVLAVGLAVALGYEGGHALSWW